jgi:hypothetical protein
MNAQMCIISLLLFILSSSTIKAQEVYDFSVEEQAKCNLACRNDHALEYDKARLAKAHDEVLCLCMTSGGVPVAIYNFTRTDLIADQALPDRRLSGLETAERGLHGASNARSSNSIPQRCPDCNCQVSPNLDHISSNLQAIAIGVFLIVGVTGVIAGSLIYTFGN